MNTQYIEQFDRNTLAFIVKYEEYFKTVLGCDDDGKYSQFALYKAYLNNACGECNDKVVVNYSQSNGFGRLYADKALSMQSFHKLVRGAIANNQYVDIDMVNAHPCLLNYICTQQEFESVYLDKYITGREVILKNLVKINPEKTREDIKKYIISLIYGKKRDKSMILSKWLRGFHKEIKEIYGFIPEWFPNHYNSALSKAKPRPLSTALSWAMNIIENDLLTIIVDRLKKAKLITNNAVLCFDGVMIPCCEKNKIKLNECIAEIEKELEPYKIKLLIKSMQKLDLSVPFEHMAKLDAVKEPPKDYDIKNSYRQCEYYWSDFIREMDRTHKSFGTLVSAFTKNISRVMFKTYDMEGNFIRKLSEGSMYNIIKKLPDETLKYQDVTEKGKVKVKCIKLKDFLNDYGVISEIPRYNKFDFRPIGVYEGDDYIEEEMVFNTWTGFKAKLVKNINHDSIAPILNHIKRVWCSDNEEHYKYVLSWFKLIFTNPSFKSKVAIVLKSSDKQIGKGILINDFVIPFIFGEQYAMSIAGLDTITCRFNQILMNKLFINCDELSTLSGSYHQSFDVMKKRITDKTCKIEIKGGASFIYPDFCNFILCTNNDFTIRVEQGDARYFMLDCSPIYKGDFAYFKTLSDGLTQSAADHFFTYVCELGSCPDIRNIPMTTLKRDMMMSSMSGALRFLMNLNNIECPKCNDEITECKCVRCEISGSDLYEKYIKWCEFNREPILTNQKFGRDIKPCINARKSSITLYDLKSIRISLE